MSETYSINPRRLPILYVLIPLGIVAVAALFLHLGQRRPTPLAMPPQAVALAEVEARDLSETWEYVAQLEADRSVDLKARVGGFLLQKNFTAGALVRKDQVLFQIEPDQHQALLDMAEAEVLSAQAQFSRATLDFTRISDLYAKQTSPKSDFDSSKAAFEVAEAQLQSARAREVQARLNLDYASIRAPFDGRISDTPYSEGSLLGPESGILATVVSSDPVLAVFGLSSRAASTIFSQDQAGADVPAGWRVRLRLSRDSFYPETGQLVYMAPTVDAHTDTVQLKARFANPQGVLRPGQILTAVLEREQSQRRLLVPKAAVLTDAEGRYVMVLREGPGPDGQAGLFAQKRPVVLEPDELDREYFIREGLAAGDKFILQGLMSGGATLRPGAPVRLLSEESAPPAAPAAQEPAVQEPAADDPPAAEAPAAQGSAGEPAGEGDQ